MKDKKSNSGGKAAKPRKTAKPKPSGKVDKAKTQNPESNGHGLYLTVTGWAKALGFDPKTVGQRLRDAGHQITHKNVYHVRVVVAAVYGDEQAERNRNLKLDADRKEREEREAAGELVSRAVMEKEIAELYTLPIGQALASMPTTLDTQCNPSDPELSRAALLRWVEETKRLIREKLQ